MKPTLFPIVLLLAADGARRLSTRDGGWGGRAAAEGGMIRRRAVWDRADRDVRGWVAPAIAHKTLKGVWMTRLSSGFGPGISHQATPVVIDGRLFVRRSDRLTS